MKATRQAKGRPTKAPNPGERVSLGLKVRSEIKLAIEEAANQSGRTQSQEAEARIESSFQAGQMLDEALRLKHGETGAALLLLIGEVFDRIGNPMFLTARSPEEFARGDWTSDAFVYKHVEAQVVRLLEMARPSGDANDRGKWGANQLPILAANIIEARREKLKAAAPELMSRIDDHLTPRKPGRGK